VSFTDRLPAPGEELKKGRSDCRRSVEEFVQKLSKPRTAWIMVPAGEPTEETIKNLASFMEPGDVIIDGGNSYYKDDVRRAGDLKARGIHFVDAGTSGGVWGIDRGYCLMVGARLMSCSDSTQSSTAWRQGLANIPLTPGRENTRGTAHLGYLHCGPVGAGHFVKMVHNGIEYGIMQAYAEGF